MPKSKKVSRKRNRKGGKAIASGSYGCVFKPALLCTGSTTRGTGISKVLLNGEALEEIAEIEKVSRVLTRIPNYGNYFLGIDATACDLQPLTDEDKINFEDECEDPLFDEDITAENVNSKLDKIKSIDVPYGGLTVSKFFDTNGITQETFTKVNNSLIGLLTNGIIPMNNLNLYHLDIKGPNVLIDDDYNSRLIDWGLARIQENERTIPIPEFISGFHLMYNQPIVLSVFDNDFKRFVKFALGSIGNDSSEKSKDIIKKLSLKWMINYVKNEGHYKLLNSSYIETLLSNDYTFPSTLTTSKYENPTKFLGQSIINAIEPIVIKYTSLDGKLDTVKFFNEVYKHNTDIIGLLSVYYDILTASSKKPTTNLLSHNITQLILKYIFEPEYQINRINIDELTRDLMALNNSFGTNVDGTSGAEEIESLVDITNIDNTNIKQLLTWYLKKQPLPEGNFKYLKNLPIGEWDVSRVTDMTGLFSGYTNFNENINNWDVSNVTKMRGTFADARTFNQPLNNWNVSNVIDMYGIFVNCDNFNQPLNDWNVSNVTNMAYAFAQAKKFNQPLNKWNVSNVTNMSVVFGGCQHFNQPLNNWNVSNVKDMNAMFANCVRFNQSLDSWNVSNDTIKTNMFAGVSATMSANLPSWYTSVPSSGGKKLYTRRRRRSSKKINRKQNKRTTKKKRRSVKKHSRK
jgi:surface protein